MDPISNFITIIRNAYLAGRSKLSTSHSNSKEGIAKILKNHGYIVDFQVEGQVPKKTLSLTLAYHKDSPLLNKIQRISKPSVRIYRSADKIPHALSGKGIVIVSTSKGLMTDKDARKQNIGGELICRLW